MRFDVADLRLFVAVVEAGSITHGATRVNLALGSASGRIKQMEEAVGVPLLARQRLGVQPTEAGHTLLRHARTTLASMQRLTDDLGQFAHGLKGTVRLLANTNALTEFVPTPVSHFLAAHPNVNIEVEERLSHEIVEALIDGVADIGIVAAAVDMGALQTFPFVTDRLCGVVPASARSFDAICRLVENGVGVSVVPESAARRCKRTMGIRVLRLHDSWALRELCVCVNERDALPTYARLLFEHLIASGSRQSLGKT